jgi:hypothetical protein
MPSVMGDPSCSGMRSSASALGSCHTVIYTPLTPGTPIGYPPGATSMGWAGVAWQHPANNWGTMPGYAIPAGATKVSFWAKGSKGGEVVTFFAGGNASPTPQAPCADPVNATTSKVTLTTTWAQYMMTLGSLTGTVAYTGGVLTGFGFAIGTADQPMADAGAPADAASGDASGAAGDAAPGGGEPTTFYVDDIQWQK